MAGCGQSQTQKSSSSRACCSPAARARTDQQAGFLYVHNSNTQAAVPFTLEVLINNRTVLTYDLVADGGAGLPVPFAVTSRAIPPRNNDNLTVILTPRSRTGATGLVCDFLQINASQD
jgi:hypothetical protein